MSWQAYVDSSLIGTGKLDKAAIFSAIDGNPWAVSSHFSPEAQEIQSLIEGFGNNLPLYEKGVYVAGERYFVIKADDRSIYGKKDREGVCAVKTKQAVIVVHYPATVQPGEAAKIVEQLADYLIGTGY